MEHLEELKFITDDNKEYIIIGKTVIDNNYYGYAINIKDELETAFVKIISKNGKILFEKVIDENIKNKILETI